MSGSLHVSPVLVSGEEREITFFTLEHFVVRNVQKHFLFRFKIRAAGLALKLPVNSVVLKESCPVLAVMSAFITLVLPAVAFPLPLVGLDVLVQHGQGREPLVTLGTGE